MESCQQNLSTRRRCYCISLRNRSGPSGNTQSAASLRPSIDASTAACRGIPAPNGTRTFFLLFFRTSAHQHAFTFNNALLVFRYVLSLIFGFNCCTKKSVKFCWFILVRNSALDMWITESESFKFVDKGVKTGVLFALNNNTQSWTRELW